jgi:hypothetical protein
MTGSDGLDSVPWPGLAAEQAGMISRRQLLELGLTPARARRDLDNRRWRAVHPGVYATFTGPLPPPARLWAAVLHAGPGAAASHRTALWLAGALDRPPEPLCIAVPATRTVRSRPGVRIVHTRSLPDAAQAATSPPRIRLEVALLDVTDAADTAAVVIDTIITATQRRLTTAERLRAELRHRPRHRHRRLLLDVLADVRDGVASPLERRYLRDVERPHGLPRGARNLPEPGPAGARSYRDVRYRRWAALVELDGREAHPAERAFRDRRRDNRAARLGEVTLRYGWREVVAEPCTVAAEVAAVLASRGWPGSPRPCGPGCAVRRIA